MTKTLKFGALALVVGVFVLTGIVKAQITSQESLGLTGEVLNYTFFATSTTDVTLATTTSATSTNIATYVDANGKMDSGKVDIRGAKKVTWYFGRSYGGGNAGSSRFEVEVSPDGSTWYDFDKLVGDDISSTATSTYTIVASTTTVPVSMNLTYDTYKFARCIVVETTDGTHTCAVTVEK